MKKIFVDTGAWAALNNKRDKFHNDPVAANKRLLNEGYFYITSDYVLDETYTLLLYDIGHKRAVEFGERVKPTILIVRIFKSKVENIFRCYHTSRSELPEFLNSLFCNENQVIGEIFYAANYDLYINKLFSL